MNESAGKLSDCLSFPVCELLCQVDAFLVTSIFKGRGEILNLINCLVGLVSTTKECGQNWYGRNYTRPFLVLACTQVDFDLRSLQLAMLISP